MCFVFSWTFHTPAGTLPVIAYIHDAFRLLVKVTKHVERFDTQIRSSDGSLQKILKVFDPVRMYVPLNVLVAVIAHVVHVVVVQIVVRLERIHVDIKPAQREYSSRGIAICV